MIDTAILLVGGRGTRLGSLTGQTPKPLLPVAGQPFILHVLDQLIAQGIRHAVLATGYLATQFDDVVGGRYRTLRITYSVEEDPLGTGGAITRALAHTPLEQVFVLNGDTYFKADLRALEAAHASAAADFSLIVRRVEDVARYGQITFAGNRVTGMSEKGRTGPGFINGGIYLVARTPLLADAPAGAFSLERDLLPRWVATRPVGCICSDGYFIDIGIPSDLARADRELGQSGPHG